MTHTPTHIPVVEVGLLGPNLEPANFTLVFYGIPKSDFMITPGGGAPIIAALERRGLTGYSSSPFLIRERRYPSASPRPATDA